MIKQILFIAALIATFAFFTFTVLRLISFFKLTKPYKIKHYAKRFNIMLQVAFGQTKIFRRPLIGFIHALVFWGFCVILVGSVEIVIDGVFGLEKSLHFLGPLYDFIFATGDIFAFIIFIAIIIFISRRLFLNIKRFTGAEMNHKTHMDAFLALTMILLLMVSLLGMNSFYVALHADDIKGVYPVSKLIAPLLSGLSSDTLHLWHEVSWWAHILLIFVFANMLPYSKHFHVFLSVPNVFLSRLEPLGKLPNNDVITKEIKLMMNPETAYAASTSDAPPERFGVKDVEDVTWKNYFDSLSCTQCGRCTNVCPAATTGKKLSPRKVMMNLRARMKEKGPGLVKNGKSYDDSKSLLKDYVSTEELWACTTCNACAQECPININHPTLIVDMRRYLVLEESSAPSGLNTIFTNITNNGAPWQFSPEDRLLWAQELYMNEK